MYINRLSATDALVSARLLSLSLLAGNGRERGGWGFSGITLTVPQARAQRMHCCTRHTTSPPSHQAPLLSFEPPYSNSDLPTPPPPPNSPTTHHPHPPHCSTPPTSHPTAPHQAHQLSTLALPSTARR